jgi:hypothetical protein
VASALVCFGTRSLRIQAYSKGGANDASKSHVVLRPCPRWRTFCFEYARWRRTSGSNNFALMPAGHTINCISCNFARGFRKTRMKQSQRPILKLCRTSFRISSFKTVGTKTLPHLPQRGPFLKGGDCHKYGWRRYIQVVSAGAADNQVIQQISRFLRLGGSSLRARQSATIQNKTANCASVTGPTDELGPVNRQRPRLHPCDRKLLRS